MPSPSPTTAQSAPSSEAAPLPPDEHTRTDAVEADLSGRSVRSGGIKLAAQVVHFVLAAGSTMILARILTPADFGLFAMVATLLAFVDSFKDFGLRMAAVQRESLSHREITGLFWFNAWYNGAILLFMLAMAPVLAWFYGEPLLLAMVGASAVGVLGRGLVQQHESLLTRGMLFGTLTAIEVGATAVGVGAGIAAALGGAGPWALVVLFLGTNLSYTSVLWVASGWRPGPYAARGKAGVPGVREMLRYGRHYTGFRVLAHLGRNLDQILVGYLSGAAVLGLYSNAYKWALTPLQQLYTPLLSVAVAGLSRVQNDPERYATYLRNGLLPLFSVVLPSLGFMFVAADSLILLLLGDQWGAAVPYFQLLCVAVFAESLHKVTKWIYLSLGETKRQFRWGLVYTPVMIVAVGIGAIYGALGVAIGVTVGTALVALPGIAYCLHVSPVQLSDFLRIVARPAGATVVAGGLVLVAHSPLRAVLEGAPTLLGDLAVAGLLFGVGYLGVWLLIPGGWTAASNLLQLVRALFPQTDSGR